MDNKIPQTPSIELKPEKKYILIAALLISVIILVGTLYWQMGGKFELFTKSQSAKQVYTNETQNYTIQTSSDWEVFEEAHYSEREKLSAEEIKNLVSTCGFSCAAVDIVKLGDYSSQKCVTDICEEQEKKEGASLTVYVFSNPDELSLYDFLNQALFKNMNARNFTEFEIADGIEAQRETSKYSDGRELHNIYFEKDGMIYRLDEDISPMNLEEHQAILSTLEEVINTFEL